MVEINEIQQVGSAARRLVEHLKKSELANTALQKQMSSDDNCTLHFVQDVKTRWNSVYNMIEHLLKLHSPISMQFFLIIL